jgi:hypothetical protein
MRIRTGAYDQDIHVVVRYDRRVVKRVPISEGGRIRQKRACLQLSQCGHL